MGTDEQIEKIGEQKERGANVKKEEVKKANEGQLYGLKIESIKDLESAWNAADRLGESLWVKLNDGKMMLVERVIGGIVDPNVKGVVFEGDDEGQDVMMSLIGTFFLFHPVVIDPTKIDEDEAK